MAFHHRKLLLPNSVSINRFLSECSDDDKKCKKTHYCDDPLFSNPPPMESKENKTHHASTIHILMFCALGAAFLVIFCLTIFRKYRSAQNNSRTTNPPQLDDTHEEFIDENHGPVLDHPIWYINTIGLPQSIIDSIAVFKYKKEEVLIEGTECSVCLSEFHDDETLRLLPKCSHAFHIPCIDTWLRSHKNCPLCRAPIVCESNGGDLASVSEPNSSDLEENLESYHVGEDGTSETRDGDENLGEFANEDETVSKFLERNPRYFNKRNSGFRVFSDLGDRSLKEVEEELMPKRRSISMDSSSASKIYRAMATNNTPLENEGCSSTKLVQVKRLNLEIDRKRVNRSLSIYKLMKSSSLGRSLQKRPISMKRSFSSSGKVVFSRSQDSDLPL